MRRRIVILLLNIIRSSPGLRSHHRIPLPLGYLRHADVKWLRDVNPLLHFQTSIPLLSRRAIP